MRIHFLIPMWGRHQAARLCFQSIERIASQWAAYGFIVDATAIVSNDSDEALARSHGLHICNFPNQGLGRKFNEGLDYVLHRFNPHYVCVLGSDDVVSTHALYWYLPFLKSGVPFFGITNPAFYNLETGEAVLYKYSVGSGALRMHRVEELRRATWKESEQRHILWPDNIGWGMDVESENNLSRAGFYIMDATPKTQVPLILDIKDEGSLSSWKSLVDSGHKPLDAEKLKVWFPEVGMVK